MIIVERSARKRKAGSGERQPPQGDPISDVSEWGYRPIKGMYPPGTKLRIGGETVDIDELAKRDAQLQAKADATIARRKRQHR